MPSIFLLGDAGVGKSSVLRKLLYDEPIRSGYYPTHSVEVMPLGMQWVVWDISGKLDDVQLKSLLTNKPPRGAIVCCRADRGTNSIDRYVNLIRSTNAQIPIVICPLDGDVQNVQAKANSLGCYVAPTLHQALDFYVNGDHSKRISNGYLENLVSDMCVRVRRSRYNDSQLLAIGRIYHIENILGQKNTAICAEIRRQQQDLARHCQNDTDAFTYDAVTSIPLPFLFKHDNFCFNVLDLQGVAVNPFTRRAFNDQDQIKIRQMIADLDTLFLV